MRLPLFALALLLKLVAPTLVAAECFCEGCGCKGGPGWRGPDGECVFWNKLAETCGYPLDTRCKYEGAEQICFDGELRAPLPKPSHSLKQADEPTVAYVALIEPAMDGRPARLRFPDLPGCEAFAETMDEVHGKAVSTFAGCAGSRIDLPAPRSLEDISQDPKLTDTLPGAFAIVINIPRGLLRH